MHKKICTRLSLAAMLIIAKNNKQTKMSIDRKLKSRLWYNHALSYHTAVKINETYIYPCRWTSYTKCWEKKNTQYDNIYIRFKSWYLYSILFRDTHMCIKNIQKHLEMINTRFPHLRDWKEDATGEGGI